MLTTTLVNIKKQGQGGPYVAHVIRLNDSATSDAEYILAMSTWEGQPLGFMVNHSGKSLRRLKRLSAVEELLAVFGNQTAVMSILPADGPVAEIREKLIDWFRLDEMLPGEPVLESERRSLLMALCSQTGSHEDDGRASDTTDP